MTMIAIRWKFGQDLGFKNGKFPLANLNPSSIFNLALTIPVVAVPMVKPYTMMASNTFVRKLSRTMLV